MKRRTFLKGLGASLALASGLLGHRQLEIVGPVEDRITATEVLEARKMIVQHLTESLRDGIDELVRQRTSRLVAARWSGLQSGEYGVSPAAEMLVDALERTA